VGHNRWVALHDLPEGVMEVFYTTLQVVFGILIPVIVVAAIYAAVIIGRSIPHILEQKVEEIKKQPPFDYVETSYELETGKDKVIFYKKDTVVWSGYVGDKYE